MKDTKKTAPKKNNTKSATRTDSKPKIKEIKFEENFLDEDENEDKRLVVFAVIAILIILATIVTLVIGCEKKENKEPVKPGEDIVVPDKKEDEDEEEDEGVDTKEVVRKVTSVYRGRRTKESSDEEKTKTDDIVEDQVYYVTYYLNDETEVKEVKEGEKATEYVPTGYSTCSYYKDEELTEEYDLEEAVTGDVNIYMSCSLITYNIVYDQETANPKTYTVEDNDVTLENESYFGWFTDQELQNQVTTLNKDIVEYSDENYNIYLYAKLVDDTEVDPTDPTDDSADLLPCEGDVCDSVPTVGETTEPGTGETTEPGTGEGVTDPQTGENVTDPQTGENVTDPQAGEVTTEPNEGETTPCEGDACQTTEPSNDVTEPVEPTNPVVPTQEDTPTTTNDNPANDDKGKAVLTEPAEPKETNENENKTEEKPKGDSDEKKPEESKPVETTPEVEETENDGE